MSMTRERFYQCSFTVGGQSRTEYVRAWTAAAAKRAVWEQLASEGFEPTGPIAAEPVGKQARAASAAALLEFAQSHR